MAHGTWNRYAIVRDEYLAEIRRIRALGSDHRDWRYLATYRQELVACRHTHYAKGRQRRYNLQFAAGFR